MKKVMLTICLMLVVSIVSGCYDVEIDKLGRDRPVYQKEMPKKVRVQVATQYENKMRMLTDLLEKEIELLKEKNSLLEDLIEHQRGTINDLKYLCHVYETMVNSLVAVMETIERVLKIQGEILPKKI